MEGGTPGVDRLWAELSVWAGDQHAGEVAESRAREAWLRNEASAGATLTGLFVDLAERGAEVVVHLSAGDHAVRGRVQAVGADFVAMTGAGGQLALVARRAVAAVRSAGLPEPAGDRPPPLGTRLADALAVLAADRAAVRLVLSPSGASLSGQLRSVGADLVTVRVPSEGSDLAVVALASIALCQVG